MNPHKQHKLNVRGIPAVIEDCPYCDGSGKRMRPDDPHTPAPAPDTKYYFDEGYRKGAKAEREQVLDKVIAFCKSNDCVQSTYGNQDCLATTDTECIVCFCESLRGNV